MDGWFYFLTIFFGFGFFALGWALDLPRYAKKSASFIMCLGVFILVASSVFSFLKEYPVIKGAFVILFNLVGLTVMYCGFSNLEKIPLKEWTEQKKRKYFDAPQLLFSGVILVLFSFAIMIFF